MSNFIADIKIPDSKLAIEAAELLREHGDELLWNHSNRVFLFAAMKGNLNQIKYDPELLCIRITGAGCQGFSAGQFQA